MKFKLFLSLTMLSAGILTCFGATNNHIREKNMQSGKSLQVRHAELGHKIDKIYYDAGTKIDKIFFDLKELQRQGNKNLTSKIDELKSISKQLRQSWLVLEKQRKEIYKTIISIPPDKDNVLKIQSLEETGGIFGWFGMHSAKIVFDNNTTISLPLKIFIYGDLINQYNVFVPAADMLCIRALDSPQNNIAMIGFDLSDKPTGKSKLIIAAIDCDKPGTTKIKISLNDNVIFSGPNPFEKFKWTTHEFPIGEKFYNYKSNAKSVDSRSAIIAQLDKLNSSAASFSQKADKLVAQQEALTQQLRADLVYKKVTIDKETWLNSYIRGIDVTYYIGSDRYQNQFVYPGNYMDLEYMGKMFHDMNVTNGWQAGVKYRKKVVDNIKKYNLPGFLWTDGTDLVGGDIVSFYYLEHKAEALKALEKLDKKYFNNYQQFYGLYVDEPIIHDSYKRYGSITDKVFFRKQFYNHLKSREIYLKAHNINIPTSYNDINLPPVTSSPLWMEWQIFKKDFIANHWSWLYEEAEKKGITLPVLLMDKNGIEPQSGSWVSYGKKLPFLMTDLYGNGAVSEGYNMQLFESAVQGKAIMTPGAGFSCSTADRFKRSLSVATAHGAGVYIWTYCFLGKYRDPNYYWRAGGKKTDMLLNYWRPEYWDITEEMFSKMKNAEQVLTQRQSVAKIVYLVSESSIINASKKIKGALSPRAIKNHNLAMYGYLVQTGKPFDLCFIESMSEKKMRQYKLAILFTATTMKDSEAEMIRNWTRGGGVLVASGTSSLYDEWGRQRKNYALSDIFGVDYITTAKKNDLSFEAFSIKAEYPDMFTVAEVKKHNRATIAGKFNDGTPALIKHNYGAGTSFLMTSERPGWIKSGFPVKRSALWGTSYPGIDKLLYHIIDNESSTDNVVGIVNQINDLAISIKRIENNRYLVQFIDWQDSRTVTGLQLKINLPGMWKVYYPGDENGSNKSKTVKNNEIFTLRDFSIHEMVVFEKVSK